MSPFLIAVPAEDKEQILREGYTTQRRCYVPLSQSVDEAIAAFLKYRTGKVAFVQLADTRNVKLRRGGGAWLPAQYIPPEELVAYATEASGPSCDEELPHLLHDPEHQCGVAWKHAVAQATEMLLRSPAEATDEKVLGLLHCCEKAMALSEESVVSALRHVSMHSSLAAQAVGTFCCLQRAKDSLDKLNTQTDLSLRNLVVNLMITSPIIWTHYGSDCFTYVQTLLGLPGILLCNARKKLIMQLLNTLAEFPPANSLLAAFTLAEKCLCRESHPSEASRAIQQLISVLEGCSVQTKHIAWQLLTNSEGCYRRPVRRFMVMSSCMGSSYSGILVELSHLHTSCRFGDLFEWARNVEAGLSVGSSGAIIGKRLRSGRCKCFQEDDFPGILIAYTLAMPGLSCTTSWGSIIEMYFGADQSFHTIPALLYWLSDVVDASITDPPEEVAQDQVFTEQQVVYLLRQLPNIGSILLPISRHSNSVKARCIADRLLFAISSNDCSRELLFHNSTQGAACAAFLCGILWSGGPMNMMDGWLERGRVLKDIAFLWLQHANTHADIHNWLLQRGLARQLKQHLGPLIASAFDGTMEVPRLFDSLMIGSMRPSYLWPDIEGHLALKQISGLMAEGLEQAVVQQFVKQLFRDSLAPHRSRLHSSEWRLPPQVIVHDVKCVLADHLSEKYRCFVQRMLANLNFCPCRQFSIAAARRVLSEGSLPSSEYLLWHGCSPSAADEISRGGFSMAMAKAETFGRGIYFADRASKCDYYTKADSSGTRTVLLSMVALGRSRVVKDKLHSKSIVPCSCCKGCIHTSILAESKEHGGAVDYREYVMFHSEACLPLFQVCYQHVPECSCAICYRKE